MRPTRHRLRPTSRTDSGRSNVNPGARLIVDSGSATDLSGHDHEVTPPGETLHVAGARVEVLGGDHAVIYPDVPVIPSE